MEVCETPWAVQSLWWHYIYTGDKDLLKNRLFDPIKNAVQFLTEYIGRPEACGENGRMKDIIFIDDDP